MFCPKCGNKLNEGAMFCPKCGEKIASAPQNVQGANINRQNKPKLLAKPAVIAVAAVAIIALILVVTSVARSNTEEGRIKKVKQAMRGVWKAEFTTSAGSKADNRVLFQEGGQSIIYVYQSDGLSYFENLYLGDVTINETEEYKGTITLRNTSNPNKQEHDYESSEIVFRYSYNKNSKILSLQSDYINDIFLDLPTLTYSHISDDATNYYDHDKSEQWYDYSILLH